MRLADSERNVMEVLWDNGPTKAKDVAAALSGKVSWGKTTTYTMITRCIDKGYIRREEPKFLCTPVLTKAQIAVEDTERILEHDYDGSAELLIEALMKMKKLDREQMERLMAKLQEMETQV